MSKFFTICSFLLSASIFAVDPAPPVLDYDFTSHVIVKGGQFKAPDFARNPEITVPVKSLRLIRGNFMTIPGSNVISIRNGITFHAVVKFQSGNDGKSTPHNMIFFKPGDFLLGRNGDKLYFNAGNGKNSGTRWLMPVFASKVPLRQWTALSATVAPVSPDRYRVILYIDGEKKSSANFRTRINSPNRELLMIGRGWGGAWFMNGLVAMIQIYNQVLTPEQIAELAQLKNKLD